MAAIDFAVITPLPEEWHAMKAHLEDVEEPPSTFPTAVGTIGRYRIVLRMAPETGEATTADITRQVVTEWNPTWLALVGVAGGFPSKDVSLGDVVVASKIYPYDFGKIHAGSGEQPSFYERRDKLDVDVDRSWLSFAKMLADPSSQRTSNWTARIKVKQRPDRGQRRRSKVHLGPVASGDKVVDDPTYQFFVDAQRSLPDLFAIEMEGAGAGTAIRNLQAERRIGLLMIRGISDLPRAEGAEGDQPRGTAQRDSWKPYAAAAAAGFFEHLLSQPGGPPPQDEQLFEREGHRNPQSSPPSQDERLKFKRLPSQATSFVGRQGEVAAATDAMRSPSTRLLTIIGTAGIGKTRLAVHVAQSMQDEFADGIAFADLAALDDPSLVPSTLLQSLGVPEENSRSAEELLTEFLNGRHILLVIDNFEHLVAARSVISTVLQSCLSTKVLVTSRRPLHISWERELSVDSMEQDEAVSLFEERARARRGDFEVTNQNREVVARICERLDRIPLAIELAAARTKTLPPSAILERLERRLDLLVDGPADVSPRHLSLRAALDWSHELLASDEQELFQRLSVFRPDFSLNAAIFVGTLGEVSDWNDPTVIKRIDSLLNDSLIRRSTDEWGPRFEMLQSIREYANERLVAVNEADNANFYLVTYMADIVDVAVRNFDAAETAVIHEYLDVERDNLRAAVSTAELGSHVSLLLRLIQGLWRYWLAKGNLTEGRIFVDKSLLLKEQIAPDQWHEFLAAAASFARAQGDFERAAELLQDCLKVVPSEHERAEALRNLGLIQLDLRNRDEGEATLRDAFKLHKNLGREDLAAYDLVSLGVAAADVRDFSQSLHHLGQADRMLQSAMAAGVEPDPLMLSAMLSAKARAWHGAKNIIAASALYELSLSIDRSIGHKQGMAYVLQGLAQTAFDLGRHGEALALTDISLGIWQELGDRRGTGAALADRDRITKLSNPAQHRQQVERWLISVVDGVVTMPEAHSQAVWAEALAELISTRLPRVAARLIGVAIEIRVNADAPLPDEVFPFRERLSGLVKDALTDEQIFEALVREGRGLGIDDLIRLVHSVAAS